MNEGKLKRKFHVIEGLEKAPESLQLLTKYLLPETNFTIVLWDEVQWNEDLKVFVNNQKNSEHPIRSPTVKISLTQVDKWTPCKQWFSENVESFTSI